MVYKLALYLTCSLFMGLDLNKIYTLWYYCKEDGMLNDLFPLTGSCLRVELFFSVNDLDNKCEVVNNAGDI